MSSRRDSGVPRKDAVLSFLAVLAVGLGLSTGAVPCASAETFLVDTTDDDAAATGCEDDVPDDCSLRGAIIMANTTAGADTINVPAGTYTLTIAGFGEDAAATGDLDIRDSLTLVGAGAAATIIQACTAAQESAPCPAGQGIADDRVFHVDPVPTGIPVTISGVTIQHGAPDSRSGAQPFGGGILLGVSFFSSPGVGTLTLSNSIVRNNVVQVPGTNGVVGGGIFNNLGMLIITNSVVSGNRADADGGGIANSGSLTLSNSTISDNTNFGNFSGGGGGGIVSYSGDVNITGSTISGNGKPADALSSGSTAGCGGGIRIDSGELRVTNSTISGNRGGDTGGGICVGSSATLNNTTITGNTTILPAAGSGGGGIFNGGVVTLSNTIIAGNTAANNTGPDCRGTLTSLGYNLIGTLAIPALFTPLPCVFTATTGDQVGPSSPIGTAIPIDPQLAPLADYGGPTRTHALLNGSPAIDAGNPDAPASGGNACAASDQRGHPRPVDGNGDDSAICDIGAFEGAGGFAVLGALPNRGGNTGPVLALVVGSGFKSGATVKLTRVGQPDIVGNPVTVREDGEIAGAFDLTGKAVGSWDVVVTNPDETSATRAGGFTIEEARAPQLWADVIGPAVIVVGRPATFHVLFGNRGNVDALGVPLALWLSANLSLPSLGFPITPPPQGGQPPGDWSRIVIDTLPPAGQSDVTLIPLLLPVVPAGFTGVLQLAVTAPFETHGQTFQVRAGIGSPYFHPDLDPQVIADLTAKAQAYAESIGVTISPTLVPQIEQYITTQLQSVVELGRNGWVASVGTRPEVFSSAQLVIDVVRFGPR